MPGNQEVRQRDDRNPRPHVASMRGGRTSITTSRFSVLPSRPRMIDLSASATTVRSRLAVGDSPCWLNSKTYNTIGVAEPGSNHGRCSGEGTDGSRNAMGGWPVTVEIAFAATLS
jgi:hypothetical protein